MKTIKNGAISICGDSINFDSSIERVDQWILRNNITRIAPTNGLFAFYEIDNAIYGTEPMRVVIKMSKSGLDSFSLMRTHWLNSGDTISDYNRKDLRNEFQYLCNIATSETNREPDMKTTREWRWIQEKYEMIVSFDPQAFEVGMFFSRPLIK